MNKIGRETLSEYIKRVVKQKDLKLRDIERNSDGKITNGYISGIVNGKITNLSVDKLRALAFQCRILHQSLSLDLCMNG